MSRPGHTDNRAGPTIPSVRLPDPGTQSGQEEWPRACGAVCGGPKLKPVPTSTSPASTPLCWHSFLGVGEVGGIKKEETSRSLPSQKPPTSTKRKHLALSEMTQAQISLRCPLAPHLRGDPYECAESSQFPNSPWPPCSILLEAEEGGSVPGLLYGFIRQRPDRLKMGNEAGR